MNNLQFENKSNFLNKPRTLLKEVEPGSSIHHTAGTSTSSHTEVSINSCLLISSHFASDVLKYYLKEKWETENIQYFPQGADAND